MLFLDYFKVRLSGRCSRGLQGIFSALRGVAALCEAVPDSQGSAGRGRRPSVLQGIFCALRCVAALFESVSACLCSGRRGLLPSGRLPMFWVVWGEAFLWR